MTDTIDAYIAAGLCPVDELGPAWIENRYEAGVATPGGYLVADTGDETLRLYAMTATGCIRTEARFDNTELGRAAFVAAARALSVR